MFLQFEQQSDIKLIHWQPIIKIFLDLCEIILFNCFLKCYRRFQNSVVRYKSCIKYDYRYEYQSYDQNKRTGQSVTESVT